MPRATPAWSNAAGRWPAAGYLLTTAQVYRAAAVTASAEVTRVRVFPHVPSSGNVAWWSRGPSGPVSEEAIDAVEGTTSMSALR